MLRARKLPERNEGGASAVEYGLLVVSIAALIAIVVFALGLVAQGQYVDSCDALEQQMKTGTSCAP